MSADLVPDAEAAIAFLELLHPGGPWVLTAITPDGPTTTETFYKPDAVAKWIERQNVDRNIYVMAAEAAGTLRKKASKDDVAQTSSLWSDLDGVSDLSRLNGHAPPPTITVESGGGLNLYWALSEPIRDREEIEARNRWLAQQLGGDHCWNADRILRLPGTINWPNKKKKSNGRVPVLARCAEYHPDRIYAPDIFGRLDGGGAKDSKHTADFGDDTPLLTLDDLPAEIRDKLPAWACRLIQEGPTPDEYNGDRSKAVFAVTAALIKAGASDNQIAGILLNPALPIHAHIADQKGHGPRAYVVRQIERAREWTKKGHEAKDGGTPEAEPPRPLTRPTEPATEYPVEELGQILGGAALAIHDKVRAPIAICGTSVLAAAALSVQGFADVVLPMGQRRPLSLYLLSVAESGARKSSVDCEALGPVESREAELRHEHDLASATYDVALAAWKAERQAVLSDKKLKGRGAKEAALQDLGAVPVAPMEPMLTAPEPTYEGLCRLLATGHPSVGVFSDEGGQFIGGHAMNADNRLKTAAAMSSLWTKGIVKRLRAGDGAQILPGRRVSMHLMVQPGVGSLLLCDDQLADQGMLSRLLVTAPDSLAGRRPWRDPRPESSWALAKYHAHLMGILQRTPPCATDKQTGEIKPNELDPRALPLSAEARALWIEWADYCDAAMGKGGELEPIAAFANKLPEQAARIAGVLTLVDDMAATEIDHDHLARAIELAKHHAAEAARIARAGVCDPDLALAAKLLIWLHGPWEHPLVSLPDIYQRGPNGIREKNVAARMIGILADHGWVTKVDGGGVVDGTRRREVWAICGREPRR